MNSADVLNYSLAICGVLLVIILGYGVYQITVTLKIARRVMADVKSMTSDVIDLKDGVKVGILALIRKILG